MLQKKFDHSQVFADNELVPLSYSSMIDPSEDVYYQHDSQATAVAGSNNHKAFFIEQFKNAIVDFGIVEVVISACPKIITPFVCKGIKNFSLTKAFLSNK